MTHQLRSCDIIALGSIIFALFIDADNIIFPPMVGLRTGEHVWVAAFGLLTTAVGLPILMVVTLAKVGDDIDSLSAPTGKITGVLLATVCYLAVGPLFATLCAATASPEVGITPPTGDSTLSLFIYNLVYFVIITLISLYPDKLLDIASNFPAPLKVIALITLSIAAIIWPAGFISTTTETYQDIASPSGLVSGYLAMDTLGAMVFGIVIINAACSRDITEARLLIRYTVRAGLMADIGLTLLYLMLFRLGPDSTSLVDQPAGSVAILHAYIQHTFDGGGSSLLAALIFVACLVMAAGLACAYTELFARYVLLSYHTPVFILDGFSMAVPNLGLDQLIQISVPVLTAIYPPCVVLVALSLTHS